MKTRKIKINRAPVLTLWACVIAERLGYKHEEALTLARALTGSAAQAHGQALGIYTQKEKKDKTKRAESKPLKIIFQPFLAKTIPVVRTKEGVRAVSNGKPIEPESVERYLASKFCDALPEARDVMQKLAHSLPPKDLSANAYKLYGRFTPKVAIPATIESHNSTYPGFFRGGG